MGVANIAQQQPKTLLLRSRLGQQGGTTVEAGVKGGIDGPDRLNLDQSGLFSVSACS